MAAFVSASMRPGQLRAASRCCSCPATRRSAGPGQVQNAFTANDDIRPDLTLFDSESPTRSFGNLLTLPIGERPALRGTVYVEGTGEGALPAAAAGAGQLRWPDRLRRTPSPMRWTRSSGPGPVRSRPTATRMPRPRPRRRGRHPDARRPSAHERPPRRTAGTPVSSPDLDAALTDIDAGAGRASPTPRPAATSPTRARRWPTWTPRSAPTRPPRRPRTVRRHPAAERLGEGPAHPRRCPPVHLGYGGRTDAGWSSSVARWAHNPEVAGSNPAPATTRQKPSQ